MLAAALAFDTVVVLLCAGLALLKGQDVSWDAGWYHYLYSWLTFHGGIGQVDPEPFPQRYLNPLPELPWYLLQSSLSPRQATAAIALVGGLNLPLVRRITGEVLPRRLPAQQRLLLSAAAVALAAGGAVFRTELGMTLADVVVSLPMLLAVLLVLRTARLGHRALSLFAGAGVLSGFAAAVKLTMTPYTVGLALAVVWMAWSLRSWRPVAAHAAGGVAGVLVGGAWWYGPLWQQLGNPVFPFFNSVFRSPLFHTENLRDERFTARGFSDAVQYPWYMLRGTRRLLDVPLRDPRWMVLCLLALTAGSVLVLRHRRGTRLEMPPLPVTTLAVFLVVSSLLWLLQFPIARYAVTTELLTGVVLLGLIWVLVQGRVSWVVSAAAALAVVLAAATLPGRYLHLPFQTTWFGTDAAPLLAVPPGAMVLTDASRPSSFVLAELPEGVRRHVVQEAFHGTRLLRLVEQEVAAASAVYVVVGSREDQLRNLERPLGLRVDAASCQPVRTYVATYRLCRATYVGTLRP